MAVTTASDVEDRQRPTGLIVVGASAGGVEALRELISGLPAELPAAVLVVLHVASGTPSVLPRILGRVSALPVTHARDGEPIVPGHVFVAPSDHHLLVKDGHLKLLRGPRENGVRPAVDPLFRSAADSYGPHVIGVILSGTLDDGTIGLGMIKRAGGISVVQDPDEALFDGMPRNAVERVDVDHVVPLAEIAPLLTRLVAQRSPHHEPKPMSDELETQRSLKEIDGGARQNEALGGHLSGFTCPECHGALWTIENGQVVRYRCRVGHAFSEEVLHESKSVSIEAALWTALTALEEQAALTQRMAQRAGTQGNADRQRRYAEKARLLEERASVIARVLRSTNFGATNREPTAVEIADTGTP